MPIPSLTRRHFLSAAAAIAAAPASSSALLQSAAARSAKPAARSAMKLGDQSGPATLEHFQYLARYGVKNIIASPQLPEGRLYPTVDELHQLQALAAKCGLSVDMTAPPFLASISVDKDPHAAIMLGQSPARDRLIDALHALIKNCAAAGIPAIKYNLVIVGDLRSAQLPGRGNALYGAWNFAQAHPPAPFTLAGNVSADQSWERIAYFLDRVIPVATEYKIRMALHPDDPGMPPQGYMGDRRVLGSIDGLKRVISIQPSPYHGLNFCIGTIAENSPNPATDVLDATHYFGTRNKIFNVHIRNIRGHRNNFVDTFPDNGDVDFVKVIQALKQVGYSGMLMPDEVPSAPDDPNGLQSYAFNYGYIRALLQSAAQLG